MSGHHRFEYRFDADGMAARRTRSGVGLYVLLAAFGLTTALLGRFMGGSWPVVFPGIAAALAAVALWQDLSPLGAQRIEVRDGAVRVHRLFGSRDAVLAALEPSWVGESLRLRSTDGRVDVLLPDLTDEQALFLLDAIARAHGPVAASPAG